MTTTRGYPKIDPESIPVMEGWLTIPDVAIELGISRQRAYQIAQENQTMLRRTSSRGKAYFMIRRSVLDKLKAKRIEAASPLDSAPAVEAYDSDGKPLIYSDGTLAEGAEWQLDEDHAVPEA